ncbi:hypothetical protein Ocin01_12559 [Orchesella cincta]|uniref:Cytochrome b561 domain-containing protein n=1 Tax=Orchesella cincta TaxID=48709 RepID=A0A1D2MMM3_ORCCI|nr:hypothetical protein Ocin01_12559 [Orchesella cincta]
MKHAWLFEEKKLSREVFWTSFSTRLSNGKRENADKEFENHFSWQIVPCVYYHTHQKGPIFVTPLIMAGGSRKLDYQKLLNESLKATRASVSAQKKEYGENYKSKYSHTVEAVRKRSAPVTSVRKSRQSRKSIGTDRMSPYSRYSLLKRQPNRKKSVVAASTMKSNEFGGFFMEADKERTARQKLRVERNKIRFSLGTNLEPKSEPNPRRPSIPATDDDSFTSMQLHTRDWHYKPNVPRRSITFRDGSIDIKIDMGDMLTQDQKKSSDDWDDDEDSSSLNKGNELATEDSIISIRHGKLYRNETLEEYTKSWQHFIQFLSFELVVALTLIVLTTVFIFVFNYGFTTSGSMDRKIMTHDRSRVLLNAHMLIMIVPNSVILGISVLTYRTFRTISRTHMKWLHGSLALIATISFSTGLYYCIIYHRVSGSPDLNSLHNILGLFCCFLQILQMATGFVYILPCCSWDIRVSLTSFHKTLGSTLLMAHGAAILTGCVNMTNKFYDTKNFPQYYPYPLWVPQKKSSVMSLIGIMTIFFITNTLYIQGNFHFRRRIKPGPETAQPCDPDDDAICKVNIRRKSMALSQESKRPGTGEDVQIGSRQSFNAKRLMLPDYGYNNQERTIPMMLNGLQQHRSNFNDDYFFWTLE